jgi:hypothetical protein
MSWDRRPRHSPDTQPSTVAVRRSRTRREYAALGFGHHTAGRHRDMDPVNPLLSPKMERTGAIGSDGPSREWACDTRHVRPTPPRYGHPHRSQASTVSADVQTGDQLTGVITDHRPADRPSPSRGLRHQASPAHGRHHAFRPKNPDYTLSVSDSTPTQCPVCGWTGPQAALDPLDDGAACPVCGEPIPTE